MRALERMSWPRTEHKLREALFFLSQLKKAHPFYQNFNFYLSAFISAARSVTWIMRSECGHIPGWEAWYNSKTPSAADLDLMAKLTTIRNESQKVGSIRTKTLLRKIDATIVDLSKAFEDIPSEDALDVCTRYYTLLFDLVSEGKNNFQL
jgi:hypothetical protein